MPQELFKKIIAYIIIFNILDIASTYFAVNYRGFTEMNPLFANSDGTVSLLESIIGTTILILCILIYHRVYNKWQQPLEYANSFALLFFYSTNYKKIQKLYFKLVVFYSLLILSILVIIWNTANFAFKPYIDISLLYLWLIIASLCAILACYMATVYMLRYIEPKVRSKKYMLFRLPYVLHLMTFPEDPFVLNA